MGGTTATADGDCGRQEEIERAHSRHLEPPRGGPVLLLLANIIVVLATKVVS